MDGTTDVMSEQKDEHRVRGPYRTYQRLSALPFGRWLFTRLVCLQAPYFGSIRPLFQDLRPGSCHVFMANRRRVRNHIGTVHALAMGNLCELAAGLVMESTLPVSHRWIPRGMTIEYLAKATTDVWAEATLAVDRWEARMDVGVPVSVRDKHGTEVVRATITMHVTERPR